VILYALVTGTLPFDDDNIRKLLQKVKTGVYTMPPSVPPGPRDLIHRMLVLDPAKRITIAEIRQHPWFRSNGRELPSPTVPALPDVRHAHACVCACVGSG
jgi:serine/threonine protein kinase